MAHLASILRQCNTIILLNAITQYKRGEEKKRESQRKPIAISKVVIQLNALSENAKHNNKTNTTLSYTHTVNEQEDVRLVYVYICIPVKATAFVFHMYVNRLR